MGQSVNDALATKVGTADKPESPHTRRVLNQDLRSGYIRIGHAASNCDDEFEYDVRVPLDDRSDEDSSRETDESEYHRCMPLAT